MKLSIFLASSCVLLPLLTFSSTSSAFFGDLSCEFESGYELPKGVSSIYPCDKLEDLFMAKNQSGKVGYSQFKIKVLWSGQIS